MINFGAHTSKKYLKLSFCTCGQTALLFNTVSHRKDWLATSIGPRDKVTVLHANNLGGYFSFWIFESLAGGLMKYARLREYTLTKLEIMYGLKKSIYYAWVRKKKKPYFSSF